MKYEARKPYLDQVRAEVAAYSNGEQPTHAALCMWCRHFNQDYDPEWGTDIECLHPLGVVAEQCFDEALYGGDCWGFAPKRGASCSLTRGEREIPRQRLIELINMTQEEREELSYGRTREASAVGHPR